MTSDIIQAAIGALRTDLADIDQPHVAEALANLLAALDAYEQRGYSPDRYERVRDTTRALAEAITHRSPA